MDFLHFKGEAWPVRVSYYALKQYQLETGKGIDTVDENITNLEILLHHALVAGCKAEDKVCPFKREDMEFILDEGLAEFNSILIGSFPTDKGSVNNSKKK